MDLTVNLISDKQLSIEDLSYMKKLLDTDLPLPFVFDLLKNRKNEKIFTSIVDELSKGKLIEDIIGAYLPKSVREYMVPMLKHFSFKNALSLSLDFYEKHNDSSMNLVSKISYPCILLFVTVTALYLFDLYGMDSIFMLLTSFGTGSEVYAGLRVMFRVFIRFFYYGILLLTGVLIYFFRPKKLAYLYLFMSKNFPSSLINIYYSEEFVSLLLLCTLKGYGSKKSLEVLKKMRNKPIVSLLAFHLDEALLEGELMKDAVKKKYYDTSLSRFIRIANYSNDFAGVLASYTKLSRERIDRKIKNYSRTIQFVTYLIIGLIIIFIYQILFMPMQALSAF